MNYIVANWKMNMGSKAALEWAGSFVGNTSNKIIVAPSHPHLPLLKSFADSNNFELSGQDISVETKGAHTGEVGAFQVKDYCKYCIIGHSERKEALKTISIKRDLCLKNGIIPIVCFVKPDDGQKLYKEGIILVWEDPSNISKGGKYLEKSVSDIEAGLKEIRYLVPEDALVLYGGSINKNNIVQVSNIQGLNGVLVGNASLDPKHFEEIISSYTK